jgi:hypothetical protein
MTTTNTPASRPCAPLAAACLAALALACGCASDRNDEMTKGVIAGERPVAMAGSGVFFGGKVTAKVTVSRGIGRGLGQGKGAGRERGGSGEKAAFAAYANSDGKQMLGSPLPPVTLHLILTNAGPDELAVKVLDFESELGNFAVDPDTVTIPPGRDAEPTAMVSQLGVSSDEIPFTVRLMLGKASDARVITVRNILDESGKPKPGTGPGAVSP